ncbi:MAG: class I SAM-dependent methyltransferase [Thermoleophilia bacterium]
MVVDVGCGTGLLALELADRVERVWAIDISPSMIDYLSTKAASADLDNIDGAVAVRREPAARRRVRRHRRVELLLPSPRRRRQAPARSTRRCGCCDPAAVSCSAT